MKVRTCCGGIRGRRLGAGHGQGRPTGQFKHGLAGESPSRKRAITLPPGKRRESAKQAGDDGPGVAMKRYAIVVEDAEAEQAG